MRRSLHVRDVKYWVQRNYPNATLLGKGMTGLAYDIGDNKVLRLQTDENSYLLLTDWCIEVKSDHSPVIHENLGLVMELHKCDVYGFITEKLQKSGRGGLTNKIVREVNNYNSLNCPMEKLDYFLASDFAQSLPESMREYFQDLRDTIGNLSNVGLDFAGQNIMQRSDGTLVFNDVVCDTKLIRSLRVCNG